MENIIKKASVLVEAIPYIHQFRKKIFVIKYGGSILNDETIRQRVLEDVVFLNLVGIRVIIVHGGGLNITGRLKDAGVQARFHQGMRITDEATLKIVDEELSALNQTIVSEIKELKGDAIGFMGHQADIIKAVKKEADVDLGHVGTIKYINTKFIGEQLKAGKVVVLAPMGMGDDGELYNINGDDVSNAMAAYMAAEKLVLLTNVQGVMRDPDDAESLFSSLTIEQIHDLIKAKIIDGCMIPKVLACIDVLKEGVGKAHIIDARIQHALLLEIFTDRGVGTQIISE